jgi:CO/xanthine dehydrogenase FAD-binding subunit
VKTFAFYRPRTLDEVWRAREIEPGARYIAGGTDLQIGRWAPGEGPPALISLRSVPELQGIALEGSTRIRALTLVADLVAHEGLAASYPSLVAAANRLGSPQIRNAATIGGNLCRAAPCADLAPPLLIHEARARIQRPNGVREVPMDEFMRGPGVTCLAPGELLTDLLMEPPPAGARSIFLKKTRVRMDLSLASVAMLLVMEKGVCRHARVAAGSVAPTPLRLREVETLVEGRKLTPALVEEAGKVAAEAVLPIDDVRTTADYRRTIVGVYVRRALEELGLQ